MVWEEYHGAHTLSHRGTVLAVLRPVREFCYTHWFCTINLFARAGEGEVMIHCDSDKARAYCQTKVRERLTALNKELEQS